MTRRTPCHFHQSPGGCRKGQGCIFLHTGPSGGSPVSPPRNTSTSDPTTPRRRPVPVAERAPNGLCNEFWATGQCKRNFECCFKHERQTPSNRQIPATSSASRVSVTPGLDATEVHNLLRKFLKDQYRFASPNEIYAFVGLIGHATEENNWNSEDGQLLLTTLATPGQNGLLRLGEIVRSPHVTIDAGMSPRQVSFQRAYFPLLMYFASEFVIKSIMYRDVTALYTLIYNNFEAFANTIKTCMEGFMVKKTFQEQQSRIPQTSKIISGNLMFASLSTVFFTFLTRFKDATTAQPALAPLVHDLSSWLDLWILGINSTPPTFEDTWASQATPSSRLLITNHLREHIRRIVTIVDREQTNYNRQHAIQKISLNNDSSANIGLMAHLEAVYEGAGNERQSGPRHNNDFTNINDIRIAPTHQELVCSDPPFLPANLPNAPHHLEAGSMERLLDIQFRLLREELIAPLRKGIQLVLEDLRSPPSKKTILSKILATCGGRYVGAMESHDSQMFNVYTNCQFSTFQLHPYRGLTVEMSLESPPGSARSRNPAVRAHFWEGKGGKRLMQGGLFALIWGSPTNPSIYLGIVAGSLKDLALSAKRNKNGCVTLQVSFFDPDAELQILQAIKNHDMHSQTLKLLIEVPVMYEAIRPFLTALCVEPTSLPFSRYLPHPRSGSLAAIGINPPVYATKPGFTFDLGCLFKEAPPENLRLSVTDSSTVDLCRQQLCEPNSRLDASQADAMIDALTREVALIQGPPGTGKTYIGVELIRVLLTNGVGPLLMIAFTNHALDHMLSSVLDAGITKKIVRLGARSTDERISKFNLDNLEMAQGESRLDRTLKAQFRTLKETQRAMDELMTRARTRNVTSLQVDTFLRTQYPDGYESLHTPPPWVDALTEDQSSDWHTAGAASSDDSLYSFWENGNDLLFLKPWNAESPSPRHDCATSNRFALLDAQVLEDEDEIEALESDNSSIVPYIGSAAAWMLNSYPDEDPTTVPKQDFKTTDQEPSEDSPLPSATDPTDPKVLQDAFFDQYNLGSRPEIPTTDRPIQDLLIPGVDMWGLSKTERTRLSRYWRDAVSQSIAQQLTDGFSRLRKNYENARVRYNEIKDQSKVHLLKAVDVVGCTTTGAAKLSALVKGFSPKVLLVEEAGQVLEAHVLGSLVPSVEQLILIGDPLQLRPNLANYNLSVDSKRGAELYRFDVSLMERLSSSGLQMPQLEVQRRMRPCIANLIRKSLYPKLKDHELTKQYPTVRGMAKDLFFMSHEHRETGGGEDSVSKSNMFEVEMAVDLVLYFLKQGSYSGDGDIVVLCAYLGQLVRMRDALAGKVITVIDERDQEKIAAYEEEHEEDPESLKVNRISVTSKVLLRTIDNFQGEEGKIVILSTVRNSGSTEDEQGREMRPSIGFLRSHNRANVALSRAKHGLYIMGNANDLASKSSMWKNVIEELDEQGCLGPAFPISCWKHPEDQNYVSVPGMLPQFAPDGGCLTPCAEPLKCGHVCPSKCHSDDEGHRAVLCNQPCLRLCPEGHPCNKLCSEPCGNCCHPVLNVSLPCGHVSSSVPCHLIKDLSQVTCCVKVEKSHPTCEHKITLACGVDVASHVCQKPCGVNLVCCGRACTATCSGCQSLNNLTPPGSSHVPRRLHQVHPCRKTLFCGHACAENCSEDHTCTKRCNKRCRQTCKHTSCKQPCHVVCAPCAQPCSWTCPHQGTCPVPCGSICARLPCDIRCSKVLPCGHQCPSLCGEPCSICVLCAPSESKKCIVDLIMQTTMEDVVPGDTLDTLIFTLSCGHSFTVETLDGVCELKEFYRHLGDKWLGLATPGPGMRQAPVCPTCRCPITIPRYGRAIRRSALDLAERNVTSDMSHSLEEATKTFHTFSQSTAEALIKETIDNTTLVPPTLSHKDREKIPRMHTKYLQGGPSQPVTPQLLGFAKKMNAHNVPQPLAMKWKDITADLVQAYFIAFKVASQRPAHIVAYENAFSTLYQQEMQEFTRDAGHAPPQPTENAMRVARFKVGQPPPRADKRFSVDALFLSLRLRFLMGELAEGILKAMHASVKWSNSTRFVWAAYTHFIYLTCCRDVELAQEIATKSESYRQIATSSLFDLRTKFELWRFDVGVWKYQECNQEQREQFLTDTISKGREARQLMHHARDKYLSYRKGDHEEEWIATNFTGPASKIMDQWDALECSIRGGTFYTPVSRDELTQIVKAFDFSHTGHWYTCPNGHVYVIGECGGATEEASCPECGSAIGGTGHNLNPTNERARDMEDIGRTQGALRTPWAWGRDA